MYCILLKKATDLILNRKVKLKDIAERTGIPYTTIRSYVVNPEKMRTAAWIRIHELAMLYDELRTK